MRIRLEELTTFLTQSTPREVPPKIWKAAKKGGCGLLVFGGLMLALGVLLMYLLFPWRLHQTWQLYMNTPATARGTVTDAPDSSMNVDDTPVYTVSFSFYGPNEELVEGYSYSYGKRLRLRQGVTIEYLPDAPHVARIKGTYLNFVGWGGVFIILVPLIGLLIIRGVIKSRLARARLLREGRFAAGHVSSISPTNVSINDQQQFRIEVTFDTAADTACTSDYKTTDAFEIDLAKAKEATGDIAGVLYDTNNTKNVLLVDTLLDRSELQTVFENAAALAPEERERTQVDRIQDAIENAPGGLFGKLKAAYDEAKKMDDK